MSKFMTPIKSIWFVDFEFIATNGNNPEVVCLVAHEYLSGRTLRYWQDELAQMEEPPYDIGKDSVFVAYYASAEMNCHLALGWEMPERVVDLYVEFRNLTNGLDTPCGRGLIGALSYYGLDALEGSEKDSMRELILSGGPWSEFQRRQILAYCESDVQALKRLYPAMESDLELPYAFIRGSYMKSVARMEFNGVPIDTESLDLLKGSWESIQDALIERIAGETGIYEGRTFKQDRFAQFLIDREIPWPRLPTGNLDLSDDTFRDMAKSYPEVSPLRELRYLLSKMRLSDLPVGEDGRNRCLLSPFSARTGRNQPSNSRFIFGPSVWLRSLIKPKEGFGIAYIDWSQQEFGIAAALSGDKKMKAAYKSGDPYLAFAKQAGAVPESATKQSHKSERDQFKACVLAVQYGMGAESLAARINQPVVRARELLRLHRETYREFWAWSDAAVDRAMLSNQLHTVFGWKINVGTNPNPRFLRNFPMQANGAEMLRMAVSVLLDEGIKVCAPIHDAVLIEAPLDELDEVISKAQVIMADVSDYILSGFRLSSDVDVVKYPERYTDERGAHLWETIIGLAADVEG
ncbi:MULTISPECIES: DNA polymerase [unclassified Marinobacterium]|uniref:DNA polymerase n=1 Tax=unclassified Marinobacterium TaxID=2644139 RepID=UPI0019DDA118|nr:MULTISPECIES: DNA polymerase [unclassified Marinobacterium]NRP52385.1 DNA polymerase I, thermostable [Marinobacterium sp. xm-v-242]NRP76966.1 DNA polymerase I, thermostable [Marinobacterium sp. xm-m-383]